MIDIQDSRKKIDEVDRKLVELFQYRMQLAKDVAEYKRGVGKPVYDPVREKEKLEALEAMVQDDFHKKAVRDLFTQIMALSRRLQYTLLNNQASFGFQAIDRITSNSNTRIAYYGEKGSYTEQAMMEYFNREVLGIPMGSFAEIMQAVKEGQADYGVLPIENSSTGTLSDIYDLLADYNNTIIGEHVIKIEHCLWGIPGASLSDIKTVYSHRQGLLQCTDFFEQHPEIRPMEGGSTASCARKILEDGKVTQAAIASRVAGEFHGLQLLKEAINKEANNSTRFIIISNQRVYQRDAKCTSICFALPHKSGSLYHMLSHFIFNNINMTRIESRPIPGKTFEYRFFIDVEGRIDQPVIQNALTSIKEEAIDMKILGCYLPVE